MMRRRVRVALVALLLTVLGSLGLASPAWAATEDTYDRYDVTYAVQADGTTRVTETVVLRFGTNSGRRGWVRTLVTREPLDNSRDLLIDIPESSVSVRSPDPSVSTNVALSRDNTGREQGLRIQVGDANRRVTTPTATYVLSYTASGLLRSPQGGPELYVEVFGSGHPAVRSSTATVTAPGGVQRADCFVGAVKSTQSCASKNVDSGTATFRALNVPDGQLFTVVAGLASGQVANAEVHAVERADAGEQRAQNVGLGIGAVGAALAPLLGWLYYRRRGHDDRFAGMPPGTFPPPGGDAGTVPNDPRLEIPVAFSPPKIPLMHAGYLLDRESKVQHITATLVGLAVSRAIVLQGGQERPAAIAQDRSRVPDTPSGILYDSLFGRGQQAVALDEPGDLDDARELLFADARQEAQRAGWFRNLPRGRKTMGGLGMVWIAILAMLVMGVPTGPFLWAAVPITVAVLITSAVVNSKLSRGQRSATGRALTDQIEGFRTYLATAEAEQLKFEEGEDIFSRYLPWAVLFGLAERWVQICQRAIELGYLDEPAPYWYVGAGWDPTFLLWNLNTWDSSLQTSAAPEPMPASGGNFDFGSGSGGFGGGSGFDGGGFAGGGFGGGDSGSW